MLPLFYQNLEDPISSVRQGAAIAISNVVRYVAIAFMILVARNKNVDGFQALS